MAGFFDGVDVGLPATEEQVNDEAAAAPAFFPLPIVMFVFAILGFLAFRKVFKE